ncbi:MAG: hypothetical protein RLZZ271_1323, partial [Pseudomonadota bacterium]
MMGENMPAPNAAAATAPMAYSVDERLVSS